MLVAGLGTAAPPHRYTQIECWEAVQQTRRFSELTPRAREILRKVLTGRNGISSRHLALNDLAEAFNLTPDALQARFSFHAPLLASQAAERALADAHLLAREVDAVLISTCTGYLCPGLTSYVGERLGLRSEILALDLVGQGCGAALPNLRTAQSLLKTNDYRRVLSICVEVCSAAFFLDDDPGVIISACLFGDGAGAAVLANEPNGNRRVEWKTSFSVLDPALRDSLRFEHRQGMLRNLLAPEVPVLAAEHAQRLLPRVLQQAGIQRADVTGWLLHPGGRDVLLALRRRLGLAEADLRWSAAVLEKYGNLSSSSLFFVLQQALGDSAPSGYWWMASFGAGFSGHGALLEVE